MFITMPKVYKMMPFGQLFMVVFFFSAFLAALTSLVNLFEAPVEALQTKFGLSRKISTGIIAVIGTAVAVIIENGDVVGVWMDVVSIYIIPLGALLAAIMFFWVCPKGFALEQMQIGREKKLGAAMGILTKYVFVGLTIIVYILGILYGGIG